MYPILLEFKFITVFSLWFFIAAGFVAGSSLFVYLAKRNRIKLTAITEHSVFLFIVTLAVSRAFFIFTHPDIFFTHINTQKIFGFFMFWDKGISFWGAVLGLSLGIAYISWKRQENPARIFDILVPSLLLGMVFGGVGAFLDGINYGTTTNLPWGVTFRSANVKYITAIHPTQLYSSLASLGLCLMLLLALKKFRNLNSPQTPGLTAWGGIFSFSVYRFLEEFLRGDEIIRIFSIRSPQLLAALMIFVSGYVLYSRYSQLSGKGGSSLISNIVTSLSTTAKKIFRSSEERMSGRSTVTSP